MCFLAEFEKTNKGQRAAGKVLVFGILIYESPFFFVYAED